ncbi:MAG: AmmeMemoRadiSam system radical SAM enzyme [Nitrospinae bacterium]|nr:AmmeMemoRadiSam system radical SAM enzyme [Nitrospinota bacterium]
MTTSTLHPASHWTKLPDGRARCELCPVGCVLSEGKTGVCRGKQVIGGEMIAVNYGRTTSLNLDPVEKKPLYHFHPGTRILSVGPNGCNLKCDFCQNYHISQVEAPTEMLSPEDLAAEAAKTGSIGVAYTYTEPLIWFEYVRDAARAVRERGMANVLVTNGFINPKPLEKLLPWIDAMNLDIKSMNPEFYKRVCKANLAPVLETAKMTAQAGVHLEITNLVIPGQNDSDALFESLTDFVAGLGRFVVLHFSRYHPAYKRTTPPTPLESLLRAETIARRKMPYVFIGNIHDPGGEDTHCPSCGKKIIERWGYSVGAINVTNGMCDYCHKPTGIIR